MLYSPDRNDDNAVKNPRAEQFEVQTQDYLRLISQSPVGRLVLDSFQALAKTHVTIRPLGTAASRKMSSRPIFDEDAKQTDYGVLGAPGKGSSATVWFYPAGIN